MRQSKTDLIEALTFLKNARAKNRNPWLEEILSDALHRLRSESLIQVNMDYKLKAKCLIDIHRLLEFIKVESFTITCKRQPDIEFEFTTSRSIDSIKAIQAKGLAAMGLINLLWLCLQSESKEVGDDNYLLSPSHELLILCPDPLERRTEIVEAGQKGYS